MKHHLILRVITKILIPPIILFALYVQFHGDYGPGGGFQAGVIFSAAFILHGLVFGTEATKRVMPRQLTYVLAALGVMIYAGVGLVTMYSGGEFLNYNYLGESTKAGQHLGVLLVELGVGITVSSVMLIIFYLFADIKKQ
jgi:multicomponent Na+:H+ antiporter subunit B